MAVINLGSRNSSMMMRSVPVSPVESPSKNFAAPNGEIAIAPTNKLTIETKTRKLPAITNSFNGLLKVIAFL